MTHHDCAIDVNGETIVLDCSGAAWWPVEKTLVLADLHFEKGSAYARSGQFLPPYDTRATIRRIEHLMRKFHPERVIALGDSFHDDAAADRLDEEECAKLSALTRACLWLWVEGNHDPDPPAWLGGSVTHETAIGGFMFRHIPWQEPCLGEISGHLHPAVRISRRGMSLWRRCFVADRGRLIMPSFGAYTGGLDVRDEAVTTLFDDGFAVYALGSENVYAVAGAPHVLLRKKNVDPQPRKIAIKTVETP